MSEMVEAFALEPYIKRRARSLSLSERMRCEIAAALLHQPQVLLADEPTIGLDIVAKKSLRLIIRNWQKYEKTTFMLMSRCHAEMQWLIF